MNLSDLPLRIKWKEWAILRPENALLLVYLGVPALYAWFAVSGTYPLARVQQWLGLAAVFWLVLLLLFFDRLESGYHRPGAPQLADEKLFAMFRAAYKLLIGGSLFLTCAAAWIARTAGPSFLLAHPWPVGLVLLLSAPLLAGPRRLLNWYRSPRLAWLVPVLLPLLRMGLVWTAGFSDGLGLLDQTWTLLFVPFGLFAVLRRSYMLTAPVWLLYLLARVLVARSMPVEKALTGDPHGASFLLVYSLSLALIFSIAYLVKREHTNRVQAEKLLTELEISHRQLQTYAANVAELAASEERNRLAREIHDSLGHYLTVINVQLEKAIAFRARSPEEADRSISESKRLAHEALQEVRRSVGALRSVSEPFSLVAALRALVNQVNAAGSFTVCLEVQGSETGYAQLTLTTLYRAAQEGLTNIQKHASATQAKIDLQLGGDMAILKIQDNGCGFDPHLPLAPDHFGLQGVKERLELTRGTLSLESAPGQGVCLSIQIPKNPLAVIG